VLARAPRSAKRIEEDRGEANAADLQHLTQLSR
jgi:hypothetical protein